MRSRGIPLDRRIPPRQRSRRQGRRRLGLSDRRHEYSGPCPPALRGGVSMERATPVEILKSIYARKAKANRRYSLRAFARDLELSPSFMTNFMKGRRRLSIERAEALAKLLELDHKTANAFVKSVVLENLEPHGPGGGLHDLLVERPKQTQ